MADLEWKTIISHSQARYKVTKSKTNGGGQASYNLKQHEEIYELFINDGVLHKLDTKRIGTDGTEITYNISDLFALILDEKIIDIVGKNNVSSKPNLVFSYTSIKSKNGNSTLKLQLKRTKNNTSETKWFQKLYDLNTENSEFILKYSKEKKEVYVMVNTILPKEKTMNNNEIYENNDYKGTSDQIIYYGVPGTGKSHQVSLDIKKYYDKYPEVDEENVIRITVHPEYSYYDFIGTVMPSVTTDENENRIISYNFFPGPFTIALSKALEDCNKDKAIFLVIEEMSRGDIGAIFGDIFQLLDRKNGVSEYGIKNTLIANYIFDDPDMTIKLPKNLSILGTLNTSDQNVFVIDNAFQRRFKFKYISTNPVKENGKYKNDFVFGLGGKNIRWSDFYLKFNKFVVENMGLLEDKQIGQFFVKFDDESEDEGKFELIKYKVLKYIWNDIHNSSVNSVDIIDNSIKSFESALSKLEKHENIFCQDFFSSLKDESESEQND